jgi:predicted MFS family arabinose efflux permease
MLSVSRSRLLSPKARVIWAGICTLILTVGIARFAYTPMLPVMVDNAGLSQLGGGWLATFNYIGYLLGALLAATLTSLNTKHHLYRGYLWVALLTTFAMGLTDNLYVWSGLRFVSGFSSTAGLLLASGLVMNWLIVNGHKPLLGVHFMGMGLGIIASGVITSLMLDRLSWDHKWWVLGVVGLVFLIPAWCWMPAPVKVSSTNQRSAPTPPAARFMRYLTLSYFCAGVGYVISATFIVAILEASPALDSFDGWVWIIVGIAALPSTFVWDRIATRYGDINALMMAYMIQIISFMIPLITDHLVLHLLSAALFGGTFVGIVSLTLSMVGRYFPVNPAKAMARLTISYGVGQIIAPMVAGFIADKTGTYLASLIMASVLMIIGLVLLAMMKRA